MGIRGDRGEIVTVGSPLPVSEGMKSTNITSSNRAVTKRSGPSSPLKANPMRAVEAHGRPQCYWANSGIPSLHFDFTSGLHFGDSQLWYEVIKSTWALRSEATR